MKRGFELPSTSWVEVYWEKLVSSTDTPRRGRAPGARAGPHPQTEHS